MARRHPPATVSAAAAKLGQAGGFKRREMISSQRQKAIAKKGGLAKAKKSK